MRRRNFSGTVSHSAGADRRVDERQQRVASQHEEPHMSTTFPTAHPVTVVETAGESTRQALWGPGLVAGVVASVATTAIAAAARAADVPLDVDGEPIPLLGFAQLTMMFTVLGVVIAAVLRRWARQPRRTFAVTTVVLTALSLVPDVIVDATTGSKLVLMLTHVVAAAVVIPTVARRLPA
jgi:hypothetical protein